MCRRASIQEWKDRVCYRNKSAPDSNGGLSREGIQHQFQESAKALQTNTFAEYYLHQPDPKHSLLESLQTLDGYYKKGLIGRIGMSNYHASEVQRAFDLCQTGTT
jgi:aryl-alcohol dehydrogenase-like predicted oxidoreductase